MAPVDHGAVRPHGVANSLAELLPGGRPVTTPPGSCMGAPRGLRPKAGALKVRDRGERNRGFGATPSKVSRQSVRSSTSGGRVSNRPSSAFVAPKDTRSAPSRPDSPRPAAVEANWLLHNAFQRSPAGRSPRGSALEDSGVPRRGRRSDTPSSVATSRQSESMSPTRNDSSIGGKKKHRGIRSYSWNPSNRCLYDPIVHNESCGTPEYWEFQQMFFGHSGRPTWLRSQSGVSSARTTDDMQGAAGMSSEDVAQATPTNSCGYPVRRKCRTHWGSKSEEIQKALDGRESGDFGWSQYQSEVEDSSAGLASWQLCYSGKRMGLLPDGSQRAASLLCGTPDKQSPSQSSKIKRGPKLMTDEQDHNKPQSVKSFDKSLCSTPTPTRRSFVAGYSPQQSLCSTPTPTRRSFAAGFSPQQEKLHFTDCRFVPTGLDLSNESAWRPEKVRDLVGYAGLHQRDLGFSSKKCVEPSVPCWLGSFGTLHHAGAYMPTNDRFAPDPRHRSTKGGSRASRSSSCSGYRRRVQRR
eukprot:TRINITY_DN7768_c0_g1_i1.p1 TRINITY_DN7768_c0_g1~~TRINITY_DN7768_c0_g1_i1.p1  ORF type:complete len:522 (+),score=59.50 TRINITY_DN7768_c0_g1_i1:161-1726(+)